MPSSTSHPAERRYDLFISYKSGDIGWVRRLAQSLATRGVKVWIDYEQIGPGEHFAECLEKGLDLSNTVGLVISAASLASGWVREEYYRAVSLAVERKVNILPILIEKISLPGFLHGRAYTDFSDERSYDRNVDRLVWPGITGRQIEILWGLGNRNACHDFQSNATSLGRLVDGLGVGTSCVGLDADYRPSVEKGFLYRGPRHIVFVNLFEDDQAEAVRMNSPQFFANRIFSLRKLTAQTDDELAFVLYHKSGSLRGCDTIKPRALKRLSHYFTIEYDRPEEEVAKQFSVVWRGAQKLLMDTALYIPHVDRVGLTEISVYGIYGGSKHIRRLKILLRANCHVRDEDIAISYKPPNIIVKIAGKEIKDVQRNAQRNAFFEVNAEGDEFILGVTGYNGVALDADSRMHAETTLEAGFSYSNIAVRIEFIQ